jgi:hypothetical protein
VNQEMTSQMQHMQVSLNDLSKKNFDEIPKLRDKLEKAET